MKTHWNRSMTHEVLMEPAALPEQKLCHSCGKVHALSTPGAAVDIFGNIHFNCICGSTLKVWRFSPICRHERATDTPSGVVCLDCMKTFFNEEG